MNDLHPLFKDIFSRMGFDQVETLAYGKPPVIETDPLKNLLTEALRECLSHYCPTCGFGDCGCSTIHHRDCPMLALLEKAEGQKLKLNMEPVEDAS